MVKMQAVQSALAVRRQRSRREEIRMAKTRRGSTASVLSSTPRRSVVSIDGTVYFDDKKERKRVLSYVTMFHVGGVLILIGLMLVITSLMPSYVKSTTREKQNDLLGTGSFFVIAGGVLTTISRFISNNEEKELNQYIKGRLARSKSGHRLNKYPEGPQCSTPSRERSKHKADENGVGPPHSSRPHLHHHNHHHHHNEESGGDLGNTSKEGVEQQLPDPVGQSSGPSSSPPTNEEATAQGYVVVGVDSPTHLSSSTEAVLSRIMEEEEEIELDTDATTEPVDSSPDSSLSHTTPLETQVLIEKRHSSRSGSKSSVKSSCKSLKLTA